MIKEWLQTFVVFVVAVMIGLFMSICNVFALQHPIKEQSDIKQYGVDIYQSSEKGKSLIIIRYDNCETRFIAEDKDLTESVLKQMVNKAADRAKDGCK